MDTPAAAPHEEARPPRARMGRPPRAQQAFDQPLFESMLAVGFTEDDVLAVFQISEASLTRAIKRVYGRAATFETLHRQFFVRTQLSVRRRALTAGMKLDADGNPHDPAMLRHIHDRYGGLTPRVIVKQDPEQHEAMVAAQYKAASDAASTRELEGQRVDRVLDLLTSALATKR